MILAIALALALGAIFTLVPLKRVVPVVVDRTDEGRVTVRGEVAEAFRPGANEKRYFLATFVRKLLTLDAALTEPHLREIQAFLRDKAVSEFSDYLRAEAPVKAVLTDPTLTRSIAISSISFVGQGDDTALVRFTTETRTSSRPSAERRRRIATLHFQIKAPDTEQEIYQNPIGLYVVHFEINDDMEKSK